MKIKIEDGIGYAIWSDAELSEAVKISRPSITRWRTSTRSPTWENVQHIENYTGLPFAFFVGRKKTRTDINNLRLECLKRAKNLKKLSDDIRIVEEANKSDNTQTSKAKEEND